LAHQTVGISSMRGGRYWRQWLQSSLASFEWRLLFGTLVPTFWMNLLPFYNAGDGEKRFLRNGATYLTHCNLSHLDAIISLPYVKSVLITTVPVCSMRHCYLATSPGIRMYVFLVRKITWKFLWTIQTYEMLKDWSLCILRFLTNSHRIVLIILFWHPLVWKCMDCGNKIPSVCKVGKSIRSQKDVSDLTGGGISIYGWGWRNNYN
jgi:hypothetical protein